MAEDGIDDYAMAKRKAARQLGLPEDAAMPNNAEIEAELRVYQALYQSEEQPLILRALRQAALEVMRFLEDFRPYLTGAVLEGTAGSHSDIDIELYAESAKEVEIFLLNSGLRFEHGRLPAAVPDGPEAVLELDWHDAPVRLTVYDTLAERTRRSTRAGRPIERARIPAVEALLEEGP